MRYKVFRLHLRFPYYIALCFLHPDAKSYLSSIIPNTTPASSYLVFFDYYMNYPLTLPPAAITTALFPFHNSNSRCPRRSPPPRKKDQPSEHPAESECLFYCLAAGDARGGGGVNIHTGQKAQGSEKEPTTCPNQPNIWASAGTLRRSRSTM